MNGVILAIFESPCCQKPSIKFLLKRIFGFEDVEEFQDGCLVHDHCLYLSGMNESFLSLLSLYANNQVSAHEDIWFGGRCCSKNINIVVLFLTIFDI